MKRHHQRQAQQLLTLSLMGSLALLAACGGGGKGGGAPAAAEATSAPVVEPKLLDVTDKDEPYLVSASSNVSEVASLNKFQLVVMDGGTQTIQKKISFASAVEGKWVAVNQIVRTGTTTITEVDKGPSTLYYVLPEGEASLPAPVDSRWPGFTDNYWHNPGGKVFQLDLRRSSKLVEKAISTVANACFIKSSYNLTQNGLQSALVITTAGPDKECGNTNGNIVEKRYADDNVDLVVATDDDATSQAGRALAQPADKVLQYLYKDDGTLTGVLAERKLSDTSAQLDVLSPKLDHVLSDSGSQSGVPILNGSSTITSYAINGAKPEVGVQWIAHAPGSNSNGYLRIQDTTISKPFNRLYKFTWDADTSTAKAELDNTRVLKAGTLATPAVTDDQYVYYVDGQTLVYGPVKDSPLPFQTRSLNFTTFTDPINEVYQTPSSVIVIQKSATLTHVFAISKKTGTAQEITTGQSSDKFKFLGVRGDKVYVSQVLQNDTKGTYLFSFSATVPWDTTDINKNFQTLTHGVIVQMSVRDNTRVYGASPLASLVTCVPTNLLGDSCQNSTLKVFDLDTAAFTKELGTLTIEDSDQITVSTTSAPLAMNNNVFQVTKTLPDGVTKRVDPWLFHSKAANSLLFVDAWKTTAAK